MPSDAAAERLTTLIDAVPREQPSAPSRTSAVDLVALLPRFKTPKMRTSGSSSGTAGFRKTPMLIGLSAFILTMLIVLALSADFSFAANPLAPRGADATMAAQPRESGD